MHASPPVSAQLELPLPGQPEPYRPSDAAAHFVGDKRPRNCRWINDGRPKKPAFGITPCEERD
jgi:hypothetical protein